MMMEKVGVKRSLIFFSLLGILFSGGALIQATAHTVKADVAPNNALLNADLVGPWFVNADGAPFPAHVMTFHNDGTFEIDNPEAGDTHTSDSIGIGPWMKTGPHSYKGKFVEINADRTTGAYVSKLIVTFTLMQNGNTFKGPAEATYYNPDGSFLQGPFPATLSGTRVTLP